MKSRVKNFKVKLRNADVIIRLKGADELYSSLRKTFLDVSDAETIPDFDKKATANTFININENDGVYHCQSVFRNVCITEPIEVMDWVLNTVGEYIIMTLPEDEMIMHASAVCIRDKAILLAGDSGSGKTTLSLILAKNSCRYAGDEYVYIKYRQSMACGENFPIHIKAGNPLLGEYAPEFLIKTYNTESGRKGYALDRSLTDKNGLKAMYEINHINGYEREYKRTVTGEICEKLLFAINNRLCARKRNDHP